MKLVSVILAIVLALTCAGCSSGERIVKITTLTPSPTPPASQSPAPTVSQGQTQQPAGILDETGMTLQARFNPPSGYQRVFADEGTITDFLRNYPLEEAGTAAKLYDGSQSGTPSAAVFQITLGEKNYEGWAGSVARVFAEYYYNRGQYENVSFTLGSQFDFSFDTWRTGKVLEKDGNNLKWKSGGEESVDRENFDAYLNTLFRYNSIDTLKKDLVAIADPDNDPIRVGDVFLQTGSDNKTISLIVVDLAQSANDGSQVMLLAQGGVPAQQLHVLSNPDEASLSPWYSCAFGMTLNTPGGNFDVENRYRFKLLADA